MAEREKTGGYQSPRPVEWSFPLCWVWTGRQFFPSLLFLSGAAMDVAGGKRQSGWQLSMGFTPARSSDLLLVALDLIHQR
jgi:hypothetical protein